MSNYVDTVVLKNEFLAAALELRDISDQIKELAEREAEAKRLIEKVLIVGERGISPDGEPLVIVEAGERVFNPSMAAFTLEDDELRQILTFQPDEVIAKKVLPNHVYDKCCTYNKAKVVAL
jgi:hypothetical protein